MSLNSTTHQERACPICQSRSSVLFAEEQIEPSKISDFTYASRKSPEFMCLRLVRCTQCDLIYAPMPPKTDFLQAAYSGAAYDSTLEAECAAKTYLKAIKPYIAQLPRRNAAIDVGAGSGPLLPWLSQEGFSTVIGIEPSKAAIQAAPPAIRSMLREGMFSPALLTDIKPSLICSFMTLEHIDNPGKFVNQAYELLEPGGILAVVVHNWRAPLNRLLGLHSPIIDVEHLQLFSSKSARSAMERAGFTSIDIKSICNTYPLRYWIRLTPLPETLKKWFTKGLNRIGCLDKQISFRVGNILAVGFKPVEPKRG